MIKYLLTPWHQPFCWILVMELVLKVSSEQGTPVKGKVKAQTNWRVLTSLRWHLDSRLWALIYWALPYSVPFSAKRGQPITVFSVFIEKQLELNDQSYLHCTGNYLTKVSNVSDIRWSGSLQLGSANLTDDFITLINTDQHKTKRRSILNLTLENFLLLLNLLWWNY